MAKTNRFSDIDLDFTRNPISGDVNILTDDVAVKRSVRNLVLTGRFERLMQPDVECRVSDQLFENPSPLTEVRVEQAIRHTLGTYENRIEVIDILINSDNDNNRLDVTVAFRIRNTEQIIEVPVRLERIR